MPLTFLEILDQDTDRKRFDEQIDELVNHARMVLATQWCFVFLFDPIADTHVYITRNFATSRGDIKDTFDAIARRVVEAPTAITTHVAAPLAAGAEGAEGAEWSFLTAQIINKDDVVIGSFLAAIDQPYVWTTRDKALLRFLANSASAFLQLKESVLPANIRIEISQQAGLWPVALDRSMFESALLNIVINARDAMPEGGAITIETSNVGIDDEYIETREEETRPGRYVMVAVTDTGCSIDETVLPYVFEPFFTTKGPQDGNGLGLAMAQGFVKQSGGIVRIYSEPGHGTSVKMFFPAAEGKTGPNPSKTATPTSLSRVPTGILLVDEQEQVRRVIEKILIAAGYQVIIASSGDEARR